MIRACFVKLFVLIMTRYVFSSKGQKAVLSDILGPKCIIPEPNIYCFDMTSTIILFAHIRQNHLISQHFLVSYHKKMRYCAGMNIQHLIFILYSCPIEQLLKKTVPLISYKSPECTNIPEDKTNSLFLLPRLCSIEQLSTFGPILPIHSSESDITQAYFYGCGK